MESVLMAGCDSKQNASGLCEEDELAPKQAKMKHLESGLHSTDLHRYNCNSPRNKQMRNQCYETLDLNVNAGVTNNMTRRVSSESAEIVEESSFPGKQDRVHDNRVASRGVDLNLIEEHVSCSGNQASFRPLTSYNCLKGIDVSECGSTTGSLESKDSMRIWKEMKQNGFLSQSHGGMTISTHKQRGRKPKNDVNKKRVNIAKREEANQSARILAPSGLLNDLNPGIINHVRNRKQVHSIIEALVKSESCENGKSSSKFASRVSGGNEEAGKRKYSDDMNDSAVKRLGFSQQDGTWCVSLGDRQEKNYKTSMNRSFDTISRSTGEDGIPNMAKRLRDAHPMSKDDTLALKLSTAVKGSDNASSLSNEESENLTAISSLSVKTAIVALQWLELLHQNVKGRLAALRRSKRRVQGVITTELPFLLSKEFASNKENPPCISQNSADKFSHDSQAQIHQAKWGALFNQMEKSLSEEERELESWLNQVRQMQRHCDQGLQQITLTTSCGSQQPNNECRARKMNSSERELAMMAAAASIYSTCSFIMSKENVSCR